MNLEIHEDTQIDSPIKSSHCLKKDFEYKHSNPYHDKLQEFQDFVLRDSESESLQGKWNSEIFKNENPLHLEIGTGYGHFMLDFCQNHPKINFVGLDYRFKRSFQLAKRLDAMPQKNFRYLRAKGERINFIFNEAELDAIYYFFPDPWPKTRHHKKRLFQTPFLDSVHKLLKPGGTLYVKTDHDGYYQWMLDFAKLDKRFETTLQSWDLREDHPEHFLSLFQTKFEKIFVKKGISIKGLVLKKI